MSVFGGLIFTNRGRNLQAKAQAGAQLTFTRIAVGDGNLGGVSIADLTALIHEVKSLGIGRLRTMADGKALVGTVLSNQDLVTGFYWRELGVFAQDPDLGEVLYCYGNAGANAEYIPAGGGPDVVEKNIDVITIVGNASSVTATIDESLIFATQADLTALQQDLDDLAGAGRTIETVKGNAAAFAAHLADGVPDGVHGIATTANLNLYVDAALGNDANTGLAAGAGNALKTIQAAVNKIPQVVNHVVTVNVVAGTYAEVVSIKGFIGSGTINLLGGTNLATAANFLVNRIGVTYTACSVYIRGFKANADGNPEFFGIGCANTTFVYCISLRVTDNGCRFDNGSYILDTCQFSNHTITGVICVTSSLGLFDCTGSANSVGVMAGVGSTVSFYNSTNGIAGLEKKIRGINGNTYSLGGVFAPVATNSGYTIYVRPDGSDDNDGSANDAAHALLTISEAIRRLPKRIDHEVTINVAAGTYNEDITFYGFVGYGVINILGADTFANAANYVILSANVRGCVCSVFIRGFLGTKTNSSAFFVLINPGHVDIQFCDVVAASAFAGYDAWVSPLVYVRNCRASNRAYGLLTDNNSRILSENNQGVGNSVGLQANMGSVISKSGTQPGGTTAEVTTAGGVIR